MRQRRVFVVCLNDMSAANLNSYSEFTLPDRYHTQRSSAARWILSHARRYWFIFASALLCALLNAAVAAVQPVLIGRIFNDVLLAQNSLVLYATLIAASQLARGVLQLGRNSSFEFISQKMERDIRDELYTSLLGKSMTFHSLQPVGDTMARATNDVREVNLMFNPGLNLVVGSASFLIMPPVAAFGYHPALVAAPAFFLISYAFSLWRYLSDLSPVSDEVRLAFSDLNTRITEAIDGIETVKGAAQERNEEERFVAANRRFRDVYVKQGDVEARFTPLLLLALTNAGGFLHAMLLYQQGVLDIGQVVGYFGLLLMFGFPIFAGQFAYSQVALGMSSARRILEIMNRKTELDQNEKGYTTRMGGEIEFRDVSFAYDGSVSPVLSGISFKVKVGQTVAIVGQTGTGKTTLAKLLNRTSDVSRGLVLRDGVDVRDWNLENLRSQISIIEQDIFLFSRSILDNIAFSRKDAASSEIETAAQAAQAHDFVLNLEDGYQTVIGERGVTLSGGQRQRIALARAFLTDPAILILDDSTSAIDSDTEDKIQRAIYNAARGRTTLMITHRLSQIRWADLIILLRNGSIEAQGSHETLLRISPAYRRIFASAGDQ